MARLCHELWLCGRLDRYDWFHRRGRRRHHDGGMLVVSSLLLWSSYNNNCDCSLLQLDDALRSELFVSSLLSFVSSSLRRYNLCLPGQERRCQDGRSLDCPSLWHLDSPSLNILRHRFRCHVDRSGYLQRTRQRLLHFICRWDRSTPSVAVFHRRP
jgi:hypothetical protein